MKPKEPKGECSKISCYWSGLCSIVERRYSNGFTRLNQSTGEYQEFLR